MLALKRRSMLRARLWFLWSTTLYDEETLVSGPRGNVWFIPDHTHTHTVHTLHTHTVHTRRHTTTPPPMAQRNPPPPPESEPGVKGLLQPNVTARHENITRSGSNYYNKLKFDTSGMQHTHCKHVQNSTRSTSLHHYKQDFRTSG